MSKEQLTIVEKQPNIVTFGGGTGSPLTHEALFSTGKVDEISAVVTPFDSGGATGRRRHAARGQEIAHSDPMRVLISLATPNGNPEARDVIKKWFNSRHPVTDAVLGQEIMEHGFNPETGYAQVVEDLLNLGIHVRGHVLPASTVPSNIAWNTEAGRTFHGEHLLDDQSMSADAVKKMWLDPEVPAFPNAIEAVSNAEVIIFSPGSLYGSVLAPTLPGGMKEALAESDADIYMITPMTSTRNETDEFMPWDFADKVQEYAGKRPKGLIVPGMSQRQFEKIHERAAKLYHTEHSHFLGWRPRILTHAERDGLTIVTHEALKIVNKDGAESVRHDPAKLGVALEEILPSPKK